MVRLSVPVDGCLFGPAPVLYCSTSEPYTKHDSSVSRVLTASGPLWVAGGHGVQHSPRRRLYFFFLACRGREGRTGLREARQRGRRPRGWWLQQRRRRMRAGHRCHQRQATQRQVRTAAVAIAAAAAEAEAAAVEAEAAAA